MAYLVINPGSSSLKYSLFDPESLSLSTSGKIERWDHGHPNACSWAIKQITAEIGSQIKAIKAIGFRVVHGGTDFTKSTIVTDKILSTIRSLGELAPSHNPIAADLIETCRAEFPKIPIVAAFDTAFHSTLPKVACTYAIPRELAQTHNLRRFGFHGIAHQYVSERLLNLSGRPVNNSRLITCHLGSGTSICAIKDGESIDTSMGLTPLAGLIMGSRPGDLDPGLILHLINNLGMSAEKVATLLNNDSGLLGISGKSADLRDLEVAASEGISEAELALECFAYSAAKYIGAYIAVLGGLDAIAFSGGIGENSPEMRQRICNRLNCFGVRLKNVTNLEAKESRDRCISNTSTAVTVWVIHADEELQIAKEMVGLLGTIS